MKLLCLADEGSNSLRFSNSKVKSHHRFYGFYRLSQIKIRNISVIRGKKNHQVVLLKKEATHYVSLLSKRKSHRFYGCHGLKQVKSVTSVISVAKKPFHCLAEEGSNSMH
jgi:stringent starvation protein B